MTKIDEKKSWIVTLRCVIEKELVTSDCTLDEAKTEPYDHADGERETQQIDYTVLSVKPND